MTDCLFHANPPGLGTDTCQSTSYADSLTQSWIIEQDNDTEEYKGLNQCLPNNRNV